MRTINLIIGFLALVLLLVIIPGTAVGLVSVWALLACIVGFGLIIYLARRYGKRDSKPNTDVTEDERAW
jgi:peptidoglycan/LPS O-acetylase OafA/YrhL